MATENIVSVATLVDYPPLVFVENQEMVEQTLKPGEKGKSVYGYSWDIVRESFHAMGYTIDLTITPWARALSYVKNGRVDVLFPTGVNSERSEIFDYSKEFVNEVNFVIYVKKGTPIVWKGLESFRGLALGVKRGFNYGDTLSSITYVNTYNIGRISQGFQMLDKGHIDGFLGYETNWDYILKLNGWQDKFSKIASLGHAREYLVTLKSNPKSKSILRAFDLGKQKLIKSGRLDELKRKWFTDLPPIL